MQTNSQTWNVPTALLTSPPPALLQINCLTVHSYCPDRNSRRADPYLFPNGGINLVIPLLFLDCKRKRVKRSLITALPCCPVSPKITNSFTDIDRLLVVRYLCCRTVFVRHQRNSRHIPVCLHLAAVGRETSGYGLRALSTFRVLIF